MPGFPSAITTYWEGLFASGETLHADQDLTIAINPALAPQRRVMLLRQAGGMTRAAVTPQIARLLSLHAHAPLRLPLPELRARLSEIGVVLHAPDHLFYYPDATEPGVAAEGDAATRQLSERDAAAFAAFQSEASEQDKEDAFVELGHWAVFGVFEQARLVSVASMYPWDKTVIADLGVLTLPGARNKGYARALVRSISRHALRLGHEPQYRCQVDNLASAALAQAAGFSRFGLWEVVSAESRDDSPGSPRQPTTYK